MSNDNVGIGGTEVKQDASEAFADIPQNRTLLVEKLTDSAPMKPEFVEGLKSVKDVFAHFQPELNVDFQDKEGGSVKEKLKFDGLEDFGEKGITKQSEFLTGLKSEKDQYLAMLQQFKMNKLLKSALSDPEKKQALVEMLNGLVDELNEAGS